MIARIGMYPAKDRFEDDNTFEKRGIIMHKQIKRKFIVYVLCLAVILTLGMQAREVALEEETNHVIANEYDLRDAFLISPTLLPVPTLESEAWWSEKPVPVAVHYSSPKNAAYPEVSASAAIETQPNELDAVSTVKPDPIKTELVKDTYDQYEVTAFLLNVREEPNAASAILRTVEQGEKLEVVEVKENGWLQLKEKGFVNGRYAEQLTATGKLDETSAKVTIQSAAPMLKEEIIENVQAEKEDESSSEPIKPSSNVASDSGLTKKQIASLFKGTALEGHGLEDVILEMEEEYGINAFFTIAVMKLESGHGKSRLAKNKNNLFGLNAIDGDAYNKAFSFKTKGDSIEKFGKLISKNYIGKGLKTIEKVAKKYCPTDDNWPKLVKSIMKSDYRKL